MLVKIRFSKVCVHHLAIQGIEAPTLSEFENVFFSRQAKIKADCEGLYLVSLHVYYKLFLMIWFRTFCTEALW